MKRDDKFTIELTAAELLKVYILMGNANGRPTGSCAYGEARNVLGLDTDYFETLSDVAPTIDYENVQEEVERDFFDSKPELSLEDINDLFKQAQGILVKLQQLNKGM